MGCGARLLDLKSWHYWTWASYLIFLYLSFLICKISIILPIPLRVVKSNVSFPPPPPLPLPSPSDFCHLHHHQCLGQGQLKLLYNCFQGRKLFVAIKICGYVTVYKYFHTRISKHLWTGRLWTVKKWLLVKSKSIKGAKRVM